MREKILELVNTKPKHFSKIIKNDQQLSDWVQQNTLVQSTNSSEMIYSALYRESNTCENNKVKQFRSINAGYKFCGRAATCICARQSVAEKVSASKNSYTSDKKIQINEKRKQTTLATYGVKNNAQTEHAKQQRRKFYQDESTVANLVSQIANTKQQRYNNPTYNNPEKIKKTFKEKFNKAYWISKYPDKDITSLLNKNLLAELYKTTPIWQIAEMLNVHIQTIYRYLNSYDIRTPYRSSEENEIVNFLQLNGITNIIRNTRSLLPSRKEIDIYLPDYNIAIEYNGVYWHHEDITHITRSYHAEKFKECERLGIQLITIFSNFWKSKNEIVKNILKSKLKLQTTSVYARKCNITEVSSVNRTTNNQRYRIVENLGLRQEEVGIELSDTINTIQPIMVMLFNPQRSGFKPAQDFCKEKTNGTSSQKRC